LPCRGYVKYVIRRQEVFSQESNYKIYNFFSIYSYSEVQVHSIHATGYDFLSLAADYACNKSKREEWQ